MSYESALEAAGATVLANNSFGDYQGTWMALVDYKGQRGVVVGSYGSCSGCDAFEAEFGYSEQKCYEHRYVYPTPPCDDCKAEREAYEEKLADFGRRYLEFGDGQVDLQSIDHLIAANTKEENSWDREAPQIVNWLQGLKGEFYGN